jgi:hypothetical protein
MPRLRVGDRIRVLRGVHRGETAVIHQINPHRHWILIEPFGTTGYALGRDMVFLSHAQPFVGVVDQLFNGLEEPLIVEHGPIPQVEFSNSEEELEEEEELEDGAAIEVVEQEEAVVPEPVEAAVEIDHQPDEDLEENPQAVEVGPEPIESPDESDHEPDKDPASSSSSSEFSFEQENMVEARAQVEPELVEPSLEPLRVPSEATAPMVGGEAPASPSSATDEDSLSSNSEDEENLAPTIVASAAVPVEDETKGEGPNLEHPVVPPEVQPQVHPNNFGSNTVVPPEVQPQVHPNNFGSNESNNFLLDLLCESIVVSEQTGTDANPSIIPAQTEEWKQRLEQRLLHYRYPNGVPPGFHT